MNTQTSKRFLIGLFASLLFATGIVQAADRLDPHFLASRDSTVWDGDPPPEDGNDGDR